MDLENFKIKNVQVLKLLSYIFAKKKFLVPEIESEFNEIAHPTIYRYIEMWSKADYIEKNELHEKVGNGIQYSYTTTERFDEFFNNFVEEIQGTLHEKNSIQKQTLNIEI